MKAADIESLRQELLRLKDELRELEASFNAEDKPVELDQARQGRLSRMDALQGQQMAKEASRRRQQQLTRIDVALKRIEAGDFGYCYICSEPIGFGRLSVDPTTTRCIDCADKDT